MRKKVGLIVMVLAILLMAHPSLKATAQPGAVTPAPSMDQKKLQIQTLQVIRKLTQNQIAEVQKEIIQLTDEEKKLQQEITGVKQGGNTPAASSTGIPDDADTQQQVQGNGGQGDQQAKLQQLQKQLKKKQNQIEQLQIELQQLKLKLPQLQQQLQQIQG